MERKTEAKPTRRFLTEEELGPILGIKVRTLQRWRLIGAGPRFRKLGGAVRYDESDVEAWIAARPCGGEGSPRAAHS